MIAAGPAIPWCAVAQRRVASAISSSPPLLRFQDPVIRRVMIISSYMIRALEASLTTDICSLLGRRLLGLLDVGHPAVLVKLGHHLARPDLHRVRRVEPLQSIPPKTQERRRSVDLSTMGEGETRQTGRKVTDLIESDDLLVLVESEDAEILLVVLPARLELALRGELRWRER